MKLHLLSLFFLLSVGWGSAQVFTLSPPQVTIDSVFFCRKATLHLAMDYPGVTIRYTRGGQSVTASSPVYERPLSLTESATIRARCFHPDFQASREVEIQVHKLDPQAKLSIRSLDPAPNPAYPGSGAAGLTDQQKGLMAFRSSMEQWTGWEADSVQMIVNLDEEASGRTLRWSALEDPGAWILGPAKVRIFQGGKIIGEWQRPQATDMASTSFVFPEVQLPDQVVANPITVTIYATRLPADHPGAGRPAWIFLDEVFLTN
jgi:hypothetical protein